MSTPWFLYPFLTLICSGRFAAEVDLTRNTSLREFALEGSAPGVLACLSTLLPQLHVCQVERITLTVRHGRYPEAKRIIDTYPWPTLDRVLGDPALCFLQRLRLVVVESLTRAEQRDVAAYILKQLPLTRGQGIVADTYYDLGHY